MISPLEESPAVREYLKRIGAKVRTLFTATITVQSSGYERETHSIRINRNGEVRAPNGLEPSKEEAERIANEVSAMVFPEQQSIAGLSNSDLPDLIKNAEDKDLFIFKDLHGRIRFIQVRIELDNGDKRYVPQTYWSDGIWRAVEPENGLPIYGIENVSKGDRVFLHEGAKAAKAANEIARDFSHPWNQYFSTGSHVGWIGGAHYLHKTMWRELIPLVGDLVIVPDNDFIGKTTIKKIVKRFQCNAKYARFDSSWPPAWDVADPLPKEFFAEESGLYVGPEFESILVPCDWATYESGQTEGSNPKPIYSIREEFAQQWTRIQNLRHYANINNPEITLDRDQFNLLVRPYSDASDTAGLLAQISGNICDKVTFMPNKPTGLINLDNEYCLNQYVDRRMKPVKTNTGSTKPFWDFFEYMFQDKRERREVARWMATLYAKPEVRMGYAILLLSKLQGVGKSTLLNIMAEVVGRKHSSFPGDAMIQSDFNGWLVNKRFVVVHEIYAGQSWKTYNRLKSLITDEFVEANNKHIVNYTLPNWVHFGAASNSMEALRVENDDRRWLVPGLPETLYGKYAELRSWISAGGLRYLCGDLMDWGDYVKPGEIAPLTVAKRALIDQSMPTDERIVLTLMERMEPDRCLDIKDVWVWLQEVARSKAFATPQRLRSLLEENGYGVDEPRRVGGRVRTIAWSSQEALNRALEGLDEAAASKRIMERMAEPGHVFSQDVAM